MNIYNIIVRSDKRIIGAGVFISIIFVLIADLLFPIIALFLRILLTIIIVVLAHFSFRKFATAKTEWTLGEDGITVKWITEYFGETKDDINIKWGDINKYKELNGRSFNLFKIYLVNGSILRFGHGGIFLRDDFTKFYKLFQEMYLKNKHPEKWAKYYKRKPTKATEN